MKNQTLTVPPIPASLSSGGYSRSSARATSLRLVIEGATVKMQLHKGTAVGVELPNSVALEVTETGPGTRGDTVSNVFKDATLETGLVVKVPLFVEMGQQVRVDTRTGEFVERV